MNCIAAVDENWGIGKNGKLLVSIPADMKFFRETTMGKTLIMGRKTLDSFPGGQPLKKRRNICLTRDPAFERDGVEVVHSVEEALALACYNFSFLAEAYNRPAVESHGKQASLL